MFYDIYSHLCEEKGVSRSRAAKEMGLSNSTVTKWKNTGAFPSGETLSKVANYFGVSMDYLLEDTDDPYDWDEDPDARLANVYGPRWDAVLESCGGDVSKAWKAMQEIDREQAEEARRMNAPKNSAPVRERVVVALNAVRTPKSREARPVLATDYAKGDWLQTFAADPPEGRAELLEVFDQLNEEGRQKAVEYMRDLVLTGRYKRD